MDSSTLTPRQSEVLRAIRRLTKQRRIPPTRRELAALFGVNIHAITGHLRSLEAHGAIELLPNVARGILVRESAA